MKYVAAFIAGHYRVLELDHSGLYREFAITQGNADAQKLATALNLTERTAA